MSGKGTPRMEVTKREWEPAASSAVASTALPLTAGLVPISVAPSQKLMVPVRDATGQGDRGGDYYGRLRQGCRRGVDEPGSVGEQGSELMTAVVELVTDTMESNAGIPVPAMPPPTSADVKLAVADVTVSEPDVTTPSLAVRRTLAGVIVNPPVVVVAFATRVSWAVVALVTAVMVSKLGMPAPAMAPPSSAAVKLAVGDVMVVGPEAACPSLITRRVAGASG